MRRSYITKRGRNLMGKDTQATLRFEYFPPLGAYDFPLEVHRCATTLEINKARLKVRLRKGDRLTISIPLGDKDRSRDTYRVTRVISQDPEKLVVQVELVWEVER